jgi:hypothetical protein
MSNAVMMKLTGINILRASTFKIRKEKAKRADEAAKTALHQLLNVFFRPHQSYQRATLHNVF